MVRKRLAKSDEEEMLHCVLVVASSQDRGDVIFIFFKLLKKINAVWRQSEIQNQATTQIVEFKFVKTMIMRYRYVFIQAK